MAQLVRRSGIAVIIAMLALFYALPVAAQDAATGSLEVADQAIVNDTITIASASISQDGFIVIHKAGPDGKLLVTPNVGVMPISAGDHSDVVVTLTEPVADGAPLWPMLHIDAGTIGTYEFPDGPDVPVMADGAPVVKMITVQASGGDAPTTLPNTGGTDNTLAILAVGFALFAAGAMVTWQARRRRA